MTDNRLSLTERDPLVVRAALVALATAAVHLLVVYGLVDGDAEVAIGGLIDAAGLVVLLFLARPAVTPNAKVVTRVTTDGQVVAGDAAVPPTGRPLDVIRDGEGQPVVEPVQVIAKLVD